MENNWYVVEHQIRERLTEARKAARIRALTHDRTSTPRRMSSVRTAIMRLAKWALGSRNAFPLELSPTLANVRPATNRYESERKKGHHHARISRGVQDGNRATRGWIRREVHEGRSLGVEGDRRPAQAVHIAIRDAALIALKFSN